MTIKHQIEIFVAMNEDGDTETGSSAEEARERLVENFGGELVRIAKLNVKMATPMITETDVTVGDEAGQDIGATA